MAKTHIALQGEPVIVAEPLLPSQSCAATGRTKDASAMHPRTTAIE